MRLFHNGSNSYIRNYTGNLEFRSLSHGSQIYFQGENAGGTNRNMLRMDPDNEVQLYYAGSEKLNTTNTGINVTGTVTASDPTAASHLATKNYVDTIVTQGVTWKAPVESGNTVVGTWGACDASKQSWTTYNKNDDIIYICDGSAWISIGSSASVPYATTTSPGRIQISGDLQGTWNNITIRDGVIDSAAVTNNSLTANDLANNSVGSAEITDGAVRTQEILDGTITSADIADNTITANDIATNAVGNDELIDNPTF